LGYRYRLSLKLGETKPAPPEGGSR